MKTSNGYIFELQFHTPQSLKIKEKNHKLYEEMRLSSTPANRKEELVNLMIENAYQIETPKLVENIRNMRSQDV